MARFAIVDDDSLVRDILRQMVARMGHEVVVEAGEGEDALEQLGQTSVDILIANIAMPGAYGLEVIQEVRTAYPDTRTIAMIGFNPVRLMLAQEMGAECIIQMPFPLREMREAIADMLAEPQAADPVA